MRCLQNEEHMAAKGKWISREQANSVLRNLWPGAQGLFFQNSTENQFLIHRKPRNAKITIPITVPRNDLHSDKHGYLLAIL